MCFLHKTAAGCVFCLWCIFCLCFTEAYANHEHDNHMSRTVSTVPLLDPLPTFPNIKVGTGYDLLFGNPLSTTSDRDTGFRGFVYDVGNYSQGQLTPDQRYRIPDGTEFSVCRLCVIDFSYVKIHGGASYVSDLLIHVDVDVKGWGAAFKGSYDYQHVESETQNSSSVFISTAASCTVYCSRLQLYTPPPLSPNFRAGAAQLLPTYNNDTQAVFLHFIGEFGTHVLRTADMGGRYGQKSQFTNTSWERYSKTSRNIRIDAAASAYGASAAAGTMSQQQKEDAATFESYTVHQGLFVTGSQFPADGQAVTWANSAITEPGALTFQLISLDEVLTADLFANASFFAAVQAALREALTDYCSVMVKRGALKNCNAPVDPTPTVRDISFGGMFEVDDCGKDNVINAWTGGLNCAAGYTPYRTARIKAPESSCGAVQLYCYRAPSSPDAPVPEFGGMYQVNDGHASDYPNALNNNQFACPAGFNDFQIERALHPELHVGTNIHICLRNSLSPSSSVLGGFFQLTDLGFPDDNIVNPFTGAASCPLGYQGLQVGRIKVPEGKQAGANSYICMTDGQ